MAGRARGFTLLEIALVLVIVGLIFGGIFKGQELLTAARVRDIIRQQEEYRTAFYGFQQRYGNPPGDFAQASSTIKNVGGPCGNPNPDGNGNSNHRIDTAGSEHTLAWEHMSKAGYLSVIYTCATTVAPGTSPVNRYNQPLEIVFDDQYAGTATSRHNLKTGGRIPSNLLAEADRKVDDGVATTGEFRAALSAGVTAAECYTAAGVWQADNPGSNCMAASLF